MGGKCDMWGEKRAECSVLVGNLSEKSNLEDLAVDGKVTLNGS
jgi:hypothetical protein